MNLPMKYFTLFAVIGFVAILPPASRLPAADVGTKHKPVFLYSRYFNAEGESRYLPDGNYKDVLTRLADDFEVRVHNKALTAETLADVKLVLIANPSDKAVSDHPAPHHFSTTDIEALA